MDLSESRREVDDAKLALCSSPSDPLLIRHLADATAILGFESGFDPKLSDEYVTLLDAAIELYESAVLLSPDDGVLLNNLGVAQCDRGFHSTAAATFRQASTLIPHDRNVHFNLAVALMNTNADGRDEAYSHFEAASKLEPGDQTRQSYFDPQGH